MCTYKMNIADLGVVSKSNNQSVLTFSYIKYDKPTYVI